MQAQLVQPISDIVLTENFNERRKKKGTCTEVEKQLQQASKKGNYVIGDFSGSISVVSDRNDHNVLTG